MCIIALVPQKNRLTDDEIDNCWAANSDGAGFAYVAGDKIKVRKGFMKREDFKKAFHNLHSKYGETSPFLVHFRIRTHGLCDAERTHPFRLPDGSVLAHNGVLSGPGMTDTTKSDTQLFIEKYGSLLSKDIVRREKEVIGKAIGFNKFAILHTDATFTVVNEGYGQWDTGRWFSNAGFRSSFQRWGKYGSYIGDY